jgi:hypothetical protein
MFWLLWARARSAPGRGGLGRQGSPRTAGQADRRALAKGKNDSLDALLIAKVVVREKNLPLPPLKGVTHDLKALVDHRETLLREATRHRNRAHAMLTSSAPVTGEWFSLTSTRRLQAARRLVEDDTGVRSEILLDTLARVEELQSSAKVMERQIEAMVKASRHSLNDIVGVSAITAAPSCVTSGASPISLPLVRSPALLQSRPLRAKPIGGIEPWWQSSAEQSHTHKSPSPRSVTTHVHVNTSTGNVKPARAARTRDGSSVTLPASSTRPARRRSNVASLDIEA